MNRRLHEFFSIESEHELMLHVFERLFLLCTYAAAREYLRSAIDEVAGGPLDVRAAVRFQPGSDPLCSEQRWQVCWDGFSGSMAVRVEGAYRGGVLEISGDCVPPDDAASDIEAAGMLASITARVLLTKVGTALERRYNDAVRLT